MNILDKIIQHKYQEVGLRKQLMPATELEKKLRSTVDTRSLADRLRNDFGIIAEFKRRSPSAGVINDRSTVQEVAIGYQSAGAAGMSVLTDQDFFGGNLDDLAAARRASDLPLLRKDFVVDEYQLLEARAYGADVVLLIAAAHTPERIRQLAAVAKELSLEVLLEIHDHSELEHICPDVDLVGVNNRNLKTFEVSFENSRQLAQKIPAEFVKVTESGIKDAADVAQLYQAGYRGFLIGGHFMAQPEPAAAMQNLAQQATAEITKLCS